MAWRRRFPEVLYDPVCSPDSWRSREWTGAGHWTAQTTHEPKNPTPPHPPDPSRPPDELRSLRCQNHNAPARWVHPGETIARDHSRVSASLKTQPTAAASVAASSTPVDPRSWLLWSSSDSPAAHHPVSGAVDPSEWHLSPPRKHHRKDDGVRNGADGNELDEFGRLKRQRVAGGTCDEELTSHRERNNDGASTASSSAKGETWPVDMRDHASSRSSRKDERASLAVGTTTGTDAGQEARSLRDHETSSHGPVGPVPPKSKEHSSVFNVPPSQTLYDDRVTMALVRDVKDALDMLKDTACLENAGEEVKKRDTDMEERKKASPPIGCRQLVQNKPKGDSFSFAEVTTENGTDSSSKACREGLCRRCLEGPQYKKGHSRSCPKSLYYGAPIPQGNGHDEGDIEVGNIAGVGDQGKEPQFGPMRKQTTARNVSRKERDANATIDGSSLGVETSCKKSRNVKLCNTWTATNERGSGAAVSRTAPDSSSKLKSNDPSNGGDGIAKRTRSATSVALHPEGAERGKSAAAAIDLTLNDDESDCRDSGSDKDNNFSAADAAALWRSITSNKRASLSPLDDDDNAVASAVPLNYKKDAAMEARRVTVGRRGWRPLRSMPDAPRRRRRVRGSARRIISDGGGNETFDAWLPCPGIPRTCSGSAERMSAPLLSTAAAVAKRKKVAAMEKKRPKVRKQGRKHIKQLQQERRQAEGLTLSGGMNPAIEALSGKVVDSDIDQGAGGPSACESAWNEPRPALYTSAEVMDLTWDDFEENADFDIDPCASDHVRSPRKISEDQTSEESEIRRRIYSVRTGVSGSKRAQKECAPIKIVGRPSNTSNEYGADSTSSSISPPNEQEYVPQEPSKEHIRCTESVKDVIEIDDSEDENETEGKEATMAKEPKVMPLRAAQRIPKSPPVPAPAPLPAKRPHFRPFRPTKKGKSKPISMASRQRSHSIASNESAEHEKSLPTKSSDGMQTGASLEAHQQASCPISGEPNQGDSFSGRGSSNQASSARSVDADPQASEDYPVNGKRCPFHMFSKADEQERLFREAAQRVRTELGNDGAVPRFRVVSSGAMALVRGPTLEHPVEDVTSLPADHWRWTDPSSRLGLSPLSGPLMVKRNFRRLALLYHPDKVRARHGGGGKEGLDNDSVVLDRFHAIKDAYEVLSRRGQG